MLCLEKMSGYIVIVWQKVLDFLVIVVGITETEKMEKQWNSWSQDRLVEFNVERSQDPAWGSTQKVPFSKRNSIAATGIFGCPDPNTKVEYIKWKWSQQTAGDVYSTHDITSLISSNENNYAVVIPKNSMRDNEIYGLKVEGWLPSEPNNKVSVC